MNEVLEALGMTKEKAISELESVIASDDDIDFFTCDEKMAMELAISALKGGWIPIVTRPMTEEERKDFPFTGYNFIGGDEPTTFDCELPDDGEEVEVTIYGHIVVDTFYNDGVEGCYFDSVDIENVTAWRRCEPYKKGE